MAMRHMNDNSNQKQPEGEKQVSLREIGECNPIREVMKKKQACPP